MKIHNVPQLNDFLAAVNRCQAPVWLESENGDRFNLKSIFSQYIALDQLLVERKDFLELVCGYPADSKNFKEFLEKFPEVQQ